MKISVIIPVYSGYTVVKQCIDSVIASKKDNTTDFAIDIIYDCSGETEIESYLNDLKAKKAINLAKNRSNLGFVKTVNKGFANTKNDCIILNSDTIVSSNWVDRFVEISLQDPSIASITPFTNNGEIASFPKMCVDNSLPPCSSIEQLDNAFKKNINTPTDIPTGVGFCMFVRKKALDEVGVFNEDLFGRGYGEENDLCMRFKEASFRNVLAPNIFVYHSGGESFGAEKQQLVDKAVSIIQSNYPTYLPTVYKFINADPLKKTRFETTINYISSSDTPKVLQISHGIGGGTDRYINELINNFQAHCHFFTLYPKSNRTITLEFPFWFELNEITFSIESDKELLVDLLKSLNFNTLHFNHIKTQELFLLTLPLELHCDYIVTLHDYYYISANPTLTNGHGIFSHALIQDELERENNLNQNLPSISYSQWEDSVKYFLTNAAKVIAPCESTKEIYSSVFSNSQITVAQHIDHENFGIYPDVKIKPMRDNVKILIIGALGKEKGADLLEKVALLADKKNLPISFELIGYAYRPLSKLIKCSGPYKEEELSTLITTSDCDLVWFPTQWPETYSYTLSSVLELGLPIIKPCIGAQHYRTLNRPATISFTSFEPDDVLNTIMNAISDYKDLAGQELYWPQSNSQDFLYHLDYIELISKSAVNPSISLATDAIDNLYQKAILIEKDSTKKKLLRILVKLRLNPFFSLFSRLIPTRIQRAIKRLLFKGPIHNL